MALYFVLPRGISVFLCARLCSFLMPALSIGLLAVLLFGLWISLAPLDMGAAMLLVLLVLCGYVILAVLGSALGEDLTIEVEGRAQALMQEELPITPRRMQLLGLTVTLLISLALLTWKLPLILALLDGAITLLMWQFSVAYLERILR